MFYCWINETDRRFCPIEHGNKHNNFLGTDRIFGVIWQTSFD